MKPQNPNIDFSRVVSSDDLDNNIDIVKGVCMLLFSLEISCDGGSHEYERYAYLALQKALQHSIENFEALKPNLEYMDDFMRYETKL